MKDMLGREIRIGDYGLYFYGTKGSFDKRYAYITGYTPKMIIMSYYRWGTLTYDSKGKPENIIILNDIPLENRKISIPNNISINIDQLPIIYNEVITNKKKLNNLNNIVFAN